MSLSNTATPKYYAKFRTDVLAGRIPVCREIEMEMNRIDALVRSKEYYYDEEAVEGWIAFCEAELTLTDGSDLKLLDSFKLWGEQILGWYYFVERKIFIPNRGRPGGHHIRKVFKRRLIRKQYLVLGRGGAKSIYGSAWHNYYLSVDRSTTQQLTTAPTMYLAEGIMAPIRTSIRRARGPLFQFLTEGSLQNTTGARANRQKLMSTKKGIENFLTGSILEVQPMTIDKLQGRRDRVVTIDEWLSGDIREDVMTAVEQGASKNNDYLIIAMSSEGTVRNAVGDSIKMELLSILKGEFSAPHVSIWYYKLDDVMEVADPAMWVKANPNIGKTVSYEAYQQDVERAEKVPSARNDILAKRFGLPMEGYTYYFTYEETKPHRPRTFWGMPCSMGIDLSQGDDFCAFLFMFPLRGNKFGIKARCYISSLTYSRLPLALRMKYDQFIDEGSLMVLDCAVLDMMTVYDDLEAFIAEREYDVSAVGYDPYNAKEFIQRWESENSSYATEKVPQGFKMETVPLGELKALASERMLLFDEQIMTYSLGNAITMTDNKGLRKLIKKRADQKIDPVSAMLDAYVAYKANKSEFE